VLIKSVLLNIVKLLLISY